MNSRDINKESILRELEKVKPSLSKKYGVNRIGLFGSFVRNEARHDSDIDVVVELTEPDLFALVHIKEFLEDDFNRPVDVVSTSAYMNAYLKTRIDKEAVYV